MKLESQVVSLELAKKLKELGVTQESAFYWDFEEYQGQPNGYVLSQEMGECSAFTVAELGELMKQYATALPWFWKNDKEEHWEFQHLVSDSGGNRDFQWADTEADARAKMLIYLIENKLITL